MIVPTQLRPAVAEEIAALVRGDRPDQLVWVINYGAAGAILIDQPADIWTHAQTDVYPLDAGGWTVTLPLWTTEESPSDLSAEVDVGSDGVARLRDVHVL